MARSLAIIVVTSTLCTSDAFSFSATGPELLGPRSRIRGSTRPIRKDFHLDASKNDQGHAFGKPQHSSSSPLNISHGGSRRISTESPSSGSTKLSAMAGVANLPASPFRIFCDMDGVLCDFSKGIQRVSGRRPEEYGHKTAMWRAISGVHDFFDTLDWTPDGQRLWQAIRHMEPDILTGVPPLRHARTGKAKWCERELGVDYVNHVDRAGPMGSHVVVNGKQQIDGVTNVITCWSSNKYHESGHRAVLIDDRVDIGQAWEKAGGIFVHHTNTDRTLEQLRARGILDGEI